MAVSMFGQKSQQFGIRLDNWIIPTYQQRNAKLSMIVFWIKTYGLLPSRDSFCPETSIRQSIPQQRIGFSISRVLIDPLLQLLDA